MNTQPYLQPGERVNVVGFGHAILEERFGHADRANVWTVTWLGKRGTPVKHPTSGRRVHPGDAFTVKPEDRLGEPVMPAQPVGNLCFGPHPCADCRLNGRNR